MSNNGTTKSDAYYYDLSYRAAVLFLLVAVGLLGMQAIHEYQLGGRFGLMQIWISLGLALVWAGVAHMRGIILLKSCQPDYGIYYVLLVVAMSLLFAIVLLDPFGFDGIGAAWDQTKQQAEAFQGLPDMTLWAFFKEGLWIILAPLRILFWLFFQIALALLAVISLLTAAGTLMLMMVLRIKSGIIIILCFTLLGAYGWALQVAEPGGVPYLLLGGLCLIASTSLACNWGARDVNPPIETYHPAFYSLVTHLASLQQGRFSRATIQEEIAQIVKNQTGEIIPDVVQRIEARLVEENLLVVDRDGYRAGFRKRLKVVHVLIGMLTIFYLLNAGCGVVELIPDNIPFLGNLDEVGLAVLVFHWLYRLYKEDKAEADGLLAPENAVVSQSVINSAPASEPKSSIVLPSELRDFISLEKNAIEGSSDDPRGKQ
jgi:uncharacterized membrane protein YkvA (DUF1232 family)